MSNKRTEAERLDALSDALSESLLAATDQEIVEEARLVGLIERRSRPDESTDARDREGVSTARVATSASRLRRSGAAGCCQGTRHSRAIPPRGANCSRSSVTKQPQYAETLYGAAQGVHPI